MALESPSGNNRKLLNAANYTNYTNGTVPRLTTTEYETTAMYSTTPQEDECVFVIIDPDVHIEDISWTLTFISSSSYSETVYSESPVNIYDDCVPIPTSNSPIDCIIFSIDDKGNDGLNYGEGNYYIEWNNTIWDSLSFGNYFNSENMTMCNFNVFKSITLDVYVSINDILSYMFLQFLDDTLIPLLDNSLTYNIIFTDLELESNATCTDNKYCISGYCSCPTDNGRNDTISNILFALCYASNSTLREMYDMEWQELWENDIDINTTQTLYEICNISAVLLLSENFESANKNNVSSSTIPTFSISQNMTDINISLYRSDLNDIKISAGYNMSACTLYSKFEGIVAPICDEYNIHIPYLCQATSANCGSNFYCSVYNDTLLTYESESGSNGIISDFKPFAIIDIVGSPLLNLQSLPSTLYGLNEYMNSKCLGLDDFIDNTTELTDIFDTIPIIAADTNNCSYGDLLFEFQMNGARAIILTTFIQDNTDNPSPAPTKAPFLSPLIYYYWVPFQCIIHFHPNASNSDFSANVTNGVTQHIAGEFGTNIRNVKASKQAQNVVYSFEANSTSTKIKLDIPVVDTLISSNLQSYLSSEKSGLLSDSLSSVSCQHSPEINESFSRNPTPAPTRPPTANPTHRLQIYDEIYIPIIEVSLSSAKQLTNAVEQSSVQTSITCHTQSPTTFPTLSPTNASVPVNDSSGDTGNDGESDAQLVIFGYNYDREEPSAAITFPELVFDKFKNVMEDTCMFELEDDSVARHEEYLVSIDSIYSTIDYICVRYNNREIILKLKPSTLSYDNMTNGLYWTAEESEGASCSDSDDYKIPLPRLDRGTYCFAVWILSEAPNDYKFRIQKRFIWTANFINIINTQFINNIAANGRGGALAIVSRDGIDEHVSVKISRSKFVGNYGFGGGGAIYREWSFAKIENYQSNYMSVLELEHCDINTSVVSINEGGSILTDLASVKRADGLFFKPVLSVKNSVIGNSTTAGDNSDAYKQELGLLRRRMLTLTEDGFGGVLKFKYSNVYIANSVIDLGKAYQGGGIHLLDTAFQIFESSVEQNKASGDGGGLYQALYQQYTNYDLCVSIYRSSFKNNRADGLGGAIYSKLYGSTDGINVDGIVSRESCFKIINATFLENGNVSVYINVTQGQHRVLRNEGPLYTFCPDRSDCADFKSVLTHLCVSEIPDSCAKGWGIFDKNPLLVVKEIPGASIVLYVYGFDAFDNRLLSAEFGIQATAQGAQVINPMGTASAADPYQYMVPLVVATGSKDTKASIIVTDIKGVADPIIITLQITDCDPGYHQKTIEDSDLFECNLCEIEKYTMGTNECESCPAGFACYGGNNVKVKENWYGKVGVGSCSEDPDNSYITTTLCPPMYCCNKAECQFPTGFEYTNKNKCENRRRLQDANGTNVTDDSLVYETSAAIQLCAPYRDPSVPMCGACLDGYSETLSSNGNCAKCKGNSNPWLVPFGVVICFGIVYFFYFMGKRKRTIPHPFMTYGSKTLLFFYQVLTFLTFRSSVQVIKPLAELVNFNFDVSEDGTCLFEGVTSRQKLWISLLTPTVILFDLIVLLSFIIIKHWRRRKKEGDMDKFIHDAERKKDELAMQSAFWGIFMIIYVQVTSAFIKLSICYPFGDKYYMWYAGDSECYDAGHIVCSVMTFILIIVVPFGIFRAMNWYKMHRTDSYRSIFAPLILAYSDRCWYYTPFNVFRRAILIVLPSLPTKELSVRATLSSFSMGSLIIVHCYLMPFKWTANNHLETFVLLCGFFISTLNITDNPPAFFPYLIAVFAVLPLLPIPFLMHAFAKGKYDGVLEDYEFERIPKNQRQAVSTEEPEAGLTGGALPTNLPSTFGAAMQQTTSMTPVPVEIGHDGADRQIGTAYEGAGTIRNTYSEIKEDSDGRRWSINLPGSGILNIYKKTYDEMDSDDELETYDEMDEDGMSGRRKTTVGSVKEERKETKFGTRFNEWGQYTIPNWLSGRFKDINVDIEQPDSGYEMEMVRMEHGGNSNILLQRLQTQLVAGDINQLSDIEEDINKCWNPLGDDEFEKAKSVDPPSPRHENESSSADEEDNESDKHMTGMEEVKNDNIIDVNKPDTLLRPSSMAEIDTKIKKKRSKLSIFPKKKSSKYYSISVEQKGWKIKTDDKYMDNGSDETDENDIDDDEREQLMIKQSRQSKIRIGTPESDINIYQIIETYPDINEIERALTGLEEYIVPNEYLYIDGMYGPKKLDESFKSMIYSHNELPSLELRVQDKKHSDINGDRFHCKWIIIDMLTKTAFYEATNDSLRKPPDSGWKRVMDRDQDTNEIGNDIEINIESNTLDSFDAPQIVALKCDKQLCVGIECDYKKLNICKAPRLKQWIEVIAINQTDKNAKDKFEIIDIESKHDEEEEEKDHFERLRINKEAADRGGKLKRHGWIRETFDFNNLVIEKQYKFRVKLSNSINYCESVLSDSIIPQTLPLSGIIEEIQCDPDKNTLFVHYKYPFSKSYDNKSINNPSINPIKLFLKILPWPRSYSFGMNDDGLFKIDEERQQIEIVHKPISPIDDFLQFEPLMVTKIHLGVKYKFVFEAENNIGSSSNFDPFIYVPLRKPPKPIIQDIDVSTDEWKMAIYFKADGHDDIDCDASFKLELIDPNTLKNNNGNNTIFNTFESRLDPQILDILNKKHESSPIVLYPLFVGQEYIIRIQCINNQGIAYSDIYKPIILEIAPPKPIITEYHALDSSVLLKYECSNYNFCRGYEPKYEIKTFPSTVKRVITTQTQGQIDSLKNGWDYSFTVRTKNAFGESDWSNKVRLRPLQKPQIPLHVQTVCGDRRISVFWCSLDNMQPKHIDGQFIVICNIDKVPVQQQIAKNEHNVEFQGLDNEKSYKFQIFAVNANFKIESEWTKSVKPISNKDTELYEADKQRIGEKIKKIKSRMQQQTQNAQEQSIRNVRQLNIDRIKAKQKRKRDAEMKKRSQSKVKRGSVAESVMQMEQISKKNNKSQKEKPKIKNPKSKMTDDDFKDNDM